MSSEEKKTENQWQGTEERGSIWLMKFMFRVLYVFGPRICKIFVFPGICYFYLTGGKNKLASREYLDNLQAFMGTDKKLSGFKHFLCYSNMLIDRLCAWSGRKMPEVVWDDKEQIRQLIHDKKGAVLLTAHMGNVEFIRAVNSKIGKIKMNALMDLRNAEKINQLIGDASDNRALEIIGADDYGPGLAVELKDKVDRGELVCLMADRIMKGSRGRFQILSFLGREARLPEGAVILALLLKVPVYMISCNLQSDNSYKVSFNSLSKGESVKRKDRPIKIKEMIQAYVSALESQCVQYPYQWGNFFPFWEQENIKEDGNK